MALWTINPGQSYDVYTVVYLLRDALISALDDALFLGRTALPKADIKGAGHAEIAARLGRFRDSCRNFREREALMLTKLLRARTWAAELRKLTPHMQVEIDQFLDTTEPCEEMKADFQRDAQRMFNGEGSLSRFLAKRKPDPERARKDVSATYGADGAYLVGGRTALFELKAACEVFLGQIEEEFLSSSDGDKETILEPLAAYLEAPAEDKIPSAPPPDALH
jgi:hypothetical protein